jgi:hypothetical protein
MRGVFTIYLRDMFGEISCTSNDMILPGGCDPAGNITYFIS